MTLREWRRARVPLRRLLGGLLIVLGGVFLLCGFPGKNPESDIRYEHLGAQQANAPWVPEPAPGYRTDAVDAYRISRRGGEPVQLAGIRYLDEKGERHSAIFLQEAAGSPAPSLRRNLWAETAGAIRKNAQSDALFIAWWDNAQRVRFLTGHEAWSDRPVPAAFPEREPRRFWEQAGGAFANDDRAARLLASWLAMDAEKAMTEMAQHLPKGRPVYFLVSTDDLARLGEIETLAGVTLPFETRTFPQGENIHTQIAEVRRWAGEKGTGSYLVQQLPQGGVRAWRITTEAGTKTLLARLLPFTTSLANPLDRQKLIYQSRWGGYLSIYQWQP